MFRLHRFPTAPDLQRRWLSNLNKKHFSLSKSSRVCSDHFLDGRRTAKNPVPFVHLGYDRKVPPGDDALSGDGVQVLEREEHVTDDVVPLASVVVQHRQLEHALGQGLAGDLQPRAYWQCEGG
ncbi:hypothetical protein ISCGN_002017 [Ixodes scapularis]